MFSGRLQVDVVHVVSAHAQHLEATGALKYFFEYEIGFNYEYAESFVVEPAREIVRGVQFSCICPTLVGDSEETLQGLERLFGEGCKD